MGTVVYLLGAFMLFLVLPGMAIGYTKRGIRLLSNGAPTASFFSGNVPGESTPVAPPSNVVSPVTPVRTNTAVKDGFSIPLNGAIETKTVGIGDDERLVLRMYLDNESGVKFITRSLRSQFGKIGYGGRQVETVQELKQLTAACCAKVNAPFSIAGAIAITCAELSKLQRDYFDENRHVAQKDEQASGQGTNAIQDKEIPFSRELTEPAFEPQQERALGAPFEGLVLSAQTVRIKPEEGKPYSIFQVHVKGRSTDRTFNGVELEEKFDAKAFKVGDHIRLVRKRTNLSVVKDGKTHRRSRNIYEIEVVKSA